MVSSQKELTKDLMVDLQKARLLKDWSTSESASKQILAIHKEHPVAKSTLKELPLLRAEGSIQKATREGDWEEVQQFAEKALVLQPTNLELQSISDQAQFNIYTNRAQLLYQKGEYRSSTEALSEALKVRQDYDAVKDIYKSLIVELGKDSLHYGPLFGELSVFEPKAKVLAIKLLEGGEEVAVVETSGVISIYNCESGALVSEHPLLNSRFLDVKKGIWATKNRRYLIWPAFNRESVERVTMEIFDLQTKRYLKSPLVYPRSLGVIPADISPDGNTFVFHGPTQEEVLIYDVQSKTFKTPIHVSFLAPDKEGEPLVTNRTAKSYGSTLVALDFDADGNLVLLCRFNKRHLFVTKVNLEERMLHGSTWGFKSSDPSFFSVNDKSPQWISFILINDDWAKVYVYNHENILSRAKQADWVSDGFELRFKKKSRSVTAYEYSSSREVWKADFNSDVKSYDALVDTKKAAFATTDGKVHIWGFRGF